MRRSLYRYMVYNVQGSANIWGVTENERTRFPKETKGSWSVRYGYVQIYQMHMDLFFFDIPIKYTFYFRFFYREANIPFALER